MTVFVNGAVRLAARAQPSSKAGEGRRAARSRMSAA